MTTDGLWTTPNRKISDLGSESCFQVFWDGGGTVTPDCGQSGWNTAATGKAWVACDVLCSPSPPPPLEPPAPPAAPCSDLTVTMWNPSGKWGNVRVELAGVRPNLTDFEGQRTATFSAGCRVPACYPFAVSSEVCQEPCPSPSAPLPDPLYW